jgi:CheY-like chemotaxis protein
VKHGVNILVVDDEQLVRDSIKMLLKHAGHEVTVVESGEAALEQLAEKKFDIVITDFSMPAMPGDLLVTRIRQMLPLQRIIMATAFAEEYKVFNQSSYCVDALLLKPFSFQAIQKVLTRKDHLPGPDVMPPSGEQSRYKRKQ